MAPRIRQSNAAKWLLMSIEENSETMFKWRDWFELKHSLEKLYQIECKIIFSGLKNSGFLVLTLHILWIYIGFLSQEMLYCSLAAGCLVCTKKRVPLWSSINGVQCSHFVCRGYYKLCMSRNSEAQTSLSFSSTWSTFSEGPVLGIG